MTVCAGLLGAGAAAELYLRKGRCCCSLHYVACADVDLDRAAATAARWGVPRACGPEELLADPDLDVVVNVTPAAEHERSGLRVLEAGHHLYSEKPLAPTVAGARRLLELAAERGLRVGCAPDTFLGPALQSARRLLDSGGVGTPFGASVSVVLPQPERSHPRPAAFFGEGAGPLFDMGPYALTALVFLLGPVARAAAFETIAPRERRGPDGRTIVPGVATHEVGVLAFAAGPVASLSFSFDAAGSAAPVLEVHATRATLWLPDPDRGEGEVRSRRQGSDEWVSEPVPAVGAQSRCAGVEDMAAAIREGRPHRASGELALHVLDVMESLRRSAATGRVVDLRTTCARPEPLP
jgi:predicted dehydrogenase